MHRSQGANCASAQRRQILDLEKLLEKVETAPDGSPDLDNEFTKAFPSAQHNITNSIDAVIRLIETELPGWWWTCGYCALSNDASFYVPGSTRFPYAKAVMGPDFRAGPRALELLNDPKWGSALTAASIVIGEAGRFRSRC